MTFSKKEDCFLFKKINSWKVTREKIKEKKFKSCNICNFYAECLTNILLLEASLKSEKINIKELKESK